MTLVGLAELLSRKRLLIFDFDGTVVDSSPIHARAFNEAFARFGASVDYSRIAGLKTEDAVNKIARELGLVLSDEQAAALVHDKRQRALRLVAAELEAIDGSIDFLRRAQGWYAMALCTSGSRATVQVSLERIGLAGSFDPLITADDIVNGKPHPEGFLKALRHHDAPPNDALVFEDAESGLAAAKAAGIDAVHIVPSGSALMSSGQADWGMLNAALDGRSGRNG